MSTAYGVQPAREEFRADNVKARWTRWHTWGLSALWHGAAGFLFGFVVLHPIAMVIFRWFDPRLAPQMGEHGPASLLSPILHAFRPEMTAMGLVFGLFSAALALIEGHYRGRLALQRDQLARQAELLGEQNKQLVRLEQANRRHTRFMVHDFKGHLAVIGGFAEVLLKRMPTRDPVEVDALTRIQRQTQRMAGAVMDLLEVARLEQSPTLRREQTSASKLLETAAADIALPTHLGRVEVGPGHLDCPDVTVDTRIIERVLVNLASNALKHNRPGTRVVLDAHAASDSGEVTFTSSDNGCGLSRAALATLFEEFATRDSMDREDSTGLGLAFCKKAVEAHGGRIWCESSEGQGARFIFTIPSSRKEQAMSTTKQQILVVDDEPDFVAYLETILREDGFTVNSAFDGEEALVRVRETPPDLVTLDIDMPRKTGVLFYRQMKSDAKLRSIPVIVVTGLRRMSEYAGPFVERFFEVDGLPLPEAYLDKPVDRDKLLLLVKEKLAVGEAAVR